VQFVRSFLSEGAAQVGWSVRVLLVAAEDAGEGIERRLGGIGASIIRVGDIYSAISMAMEDPDIADLLVVDCDPLGGLGEMRRIVKLMGEAMAKVPVILVTSDCQTQIFALERTEPTVLRAPLSAVSTRVAFEHVMRDRLAPRAV
jgi:hypothetical protein